MNQNYSTYTPADHEVWQVLFERQMQKLPAIASQDYLDGIEKAGFTAEHIPNFDKEINPKLQALTGWTVVACEGLVPIKEFFELLADKKFPASTWLRTMEQLEYLEEPDMFHDIFGHVPLLSNQSICHFLQELARIALRFIDKPQAIEFIARLYWYTIEFGLIREDEKLKIYGAGILSSAGESIYSLQSSQPQRLDYNIQQIFDTPYIKEHYQEQYFIIDSYEQLFNSIPFIEAELEKRMLVKTPRKVFKLNDSEIKYQYANV